MPSPYARDALRLKAEIVARVDAGETLRGLRASPGLPSEQTIRNWAKTDPPFADALAAARRRGTWRRHCAFDEAKAAAFLERARAGEPINSLIGRPGMPSRGSYTHWNRTQAAFAEAIFALRQRRDAQIGERGRARRRVFDQALADRIIVRLHKGGTLDEVLRADPELPCWETMMRWRRQQPEFDQVLRMVSAARRRKPRPVPEFLIDDLAEHIADGGTFASYSRQPDAPSRGALQRWMRDPSFAERIAKACDQRDELLDFEIWLAAERTPPGPVREMNRAIGPLLRRQSQERPGTPKRKTPVSPL